jgi:hypothetical protein
MNTLFKQSTPVTTQRTLASMWKNISITENDGQTQKEISQSTYMSRRTRNRSNRMVVAQTISNKHNSNNKTISSIQSTSVDFYGVS